MRRLPSLILMLTLCGVGSEAAAAISIAGAQTYAKVFVAETTNDFLDPSFPNATAEATLLDASSHTDGTYVTTGDTASFFAEFAQSRPGALESLTVGSGVVNFSLEVDESYSISAVFANPSGFAVLETYILDVTTNSYVFHDLQKNQGGPVTLTAGVTTGNYFDQYTGSLGSLTGVLLAGHDYRWGVEGSTTAAPIEDGGAIASGNGLLVLTPAVAVPEPASLFIWTLLGLAFSGAVWRQKRRASA